MRIEFTQRFLVTKACWWRSHYMMRCCVHDHGLKITQHEWKQIFANYIYIVIAGQVQQRRAREQVRKYVCFFKFFNQLMGTTHNESKLCWLGRLKWRWRGSLMTWRNFSRNFYANYLDYCSFISILAMIAIWWCEEMLALNGISLGENDIIRSAA